MVYLYRYIPNILTVLRMGSAPFLWHVIMMHETVPALLLITFAVLSDVGDGYMARRLFVTSRSGSFLDPLADKIVVLASFIALWQQHIVPLWVVIIIAIRDVAVTWLRTFFLRWGTPLRTSWVAKSKTAFQFMALYLLIGFGCLETFPSGGNPHTTFFYGVSVAVAAITVLSALQYLYRFCLVITRAC